MYESKDGWGEAITIKITITSRKDPQDGHRGAFNSSGVRVSVDAFPRIARRIAHEFG